MKRFLVIPFLICFTLVALAQEPDYAESIIKERAETDDYFKNDEHSPLSNKAKRKFKKLKYYPVDPKFRVEAILEINENPDTFQMKTTTDRLPLYYTYGTITFELDGEKHQLQVYRNIDLMQKEEYKDYLFLPFLDETGGMGSYGGGRYLDVRIPKEGNIIVVDFNKAYNPYCVYSKKYSCPIVPAVNRLLIPIEAGVKDY